MGSALNVHTDEEMVAMYQRAGFTDVIVRSKGNLQLARGYHSSWFKAAFAPLIRNPVDYFAAFVVRESGVVFVFSDSRSERSDAPPDSRAHQRCIIYPDSV